MARSPTLKSLLHCKPGRVWSWVFLSFILLLVAFIRFRLCDLPLERDEGEYAYGGQLFLEGIPPGKLAYTIKLPGTHAAYAIMMLFFGQSCAGIHIGFLVMNCTTIVLLYLLSRPLAGEIAGCVAAATYALISLSGDVLGTAAHATHFVVLTALGGLSLLLQASKTGKRPAYFASGLLLSTSVLMKHNGLFFLGFGAACLAWLGYSKTLGPNATILNAVLAFISGAVTPFLLLLLVLWLAGTFENCWFWSVTYARAYAKPSPGIMIVRRMFLQRMPQVMAIPFYAALVGLLVLWLRRNSWRVAPFATGFVFTSALAVVPGLHFRPHYYVLLAPAIALLTGTLTQNSTDFLRSRFKLLTPIPILIVALFFAKGVSRERNLFFQMSPLEASRSLYGFQPFPEAIVLSDYIRRHSPLNARVAVLGSEPEIYFYSHRHSATGYIYTYPLAEHHPFAQEMQHQMAQEIETAQPQFIIQVRTWTSWLSRPGPPNRIDPVCHDLTPKYYKLVGTCDVLPHESRVVWNWQLEPSADVTGASTELLVFERISPVEEKTQQ